MLLDRLQLLQYIWLKLVPESAENLVELLAHDTHDLALVDDAVEGVSHFMRDGGVDEAQELALCLGGVIQDLLGYVDEAEHHTVNITRIASDIALLHLDEFELWNIFFIDVLHAWQSPNDYINIF